VKSGSQNATEDQRAGSVTNNELGEESNAHRQIIEYLIQVHARVARDVVQIAPSTWAIHGPIAVDGEVIMAEFSSRDAADVAIDQLWSAEHGPPAP
jgi:hypothetical protein